MEELLKIKLSFFFIFWQNERCVWEYLLQKHTKRPDVTTEPHFLGVLEQNFRGTYVQTGLDFDIYFSTFKITDFLTRLQIWNLKQFVLERYYIFKLEIQMDNAICVHAL